ncbi:glycosyltransferase [Rhodohalobacter sulfatireducens]|uniref:Glycosyltransferase n=1 Tax=Rhodohalobacter sulfatireducens TaxID=2911366 RepID=A0ABS9KI40_9BACT|nr:glycosyltransferase [Rhodohalobacter sulfatireducens]MCG2590518.1 glycosyltransferase [Rhodohalobacter sulfatireducens]
MKIIDVAEFYTDQGGGVKTYINQKLKAANRLGHEMVIIAPNTEPGEEERFGGRVIWVQGPRLPLDPRYTILWRQKEVHKIIDREKPDVVEGSSAWTGGWFAGQWKGDAVKTLIFHQDPVAVYPHTFLGNFFSLDRIDRLFSFYWRFLKKLSNKYDATIVSGDWLENRLKKYNIHNPVSIPFGIDKNFFSPERRDSELRSKILKELGLPEEAHLLISVSRHHPEKRLSTIIDGFKIASENKPMGLIIFGGGPIKKWIEFKVKDVENIQLMGFTSNRSELADIMASCDYFVHGSAAETFGLVVAEAICSGLPIVVPDSGGGTDLADPDYAEIYETGNNTSLAEALLRVTGRDRSHLTNCCANAAIESIRTVDEHFNHLFSFYKKLIDEKEGV